MMDNYNTYIDLLCKSGNLINDGKREGEEYLDLLKKMNILWEELTESEQFSANEQTLSIK